MGGHGGTRNEIARRLLGTVATAVVSEAPVTVTVVRSAWLADHTLLGPGYRAPLLAPIHAEADHDAGDECDEPEPDSHTYLPARDAGGAAGQAAADDPETMTLSTRWGCQARWRPARCEPGDQRRDGAADAELRVLAGGRPSQAGCAHPRATEDTHCAERQQYEPGQAEFGAVEVLQRAGCEADLTPAAEKATTLPRTTRKVVTRIAVAWVCRRTRGAPRGDQPRRGDGGDTVPATTRRAGQRARSVPAGEGMMLD